MVRETSLLTIKQRQGALALQPVDARATKITEGRLINLFICELYRRCTGCRI